MLPASGCGSQTPSKNTPANCQRQLCCGRNEAGDKTRKSLMKIACKWFLFLPACHVMVARFACKTFGLLSARLWLWLWLCAKAAKAKSLPRTWTWKSRLPDALNSKFSHIFLDSLRRRRRRLQLELCTHTHTHAYMDFHPHMLAHYTNSVCRGNSCSPPSQLVARR